jgi:hypothetical protein
MLPWGAGTIGPRFPPPRPPTLLPSLCSGKTLEQQGCGRGVKRSVGVHNNDNEEGINTHTDGHGLGNTDLSGHLSQKDLRACKERSPKYRGARTDGIGAIFHMANSAVTPQRDTLQVTGSSYPIRCVPDRPPQRGVQTERTEAAANSGNRMIRLIRRSALPLSILVPGIPKKTALALRRTGLPSLLCQISAPRPKSKRVGWSRRPSVAAGGSVGDRPQLATAGASQSAHYLLPTASCRLPTACFWARYGAFAGRRETP